MATRRSTRARKAAPEKPEPRPHSTALVIQGPKPKWQSKAREAEKLPTPEDLTVPAALLVAADMASEHKLENSALGGVYLHAKEGAGRIVGTDGKRMFAASFRLRDPIPAWLADGVILSNEGLKARVGMISKTGAQAAVTLRFAKGFPRVEVSDARREMVFQLPVIQADYPEYERFFKVSSFVSLDTEGERDAKEWEPIGINSAYLKHVGEIAKVLETGLPKEERSKTGMVVRTYTSAPSAPVVFDFSLWPGAVLVIGVSKPDDKGMSPETAQLLAPAIRLTLIALKAHVTRNLAWAEDATDEVLKAGYMIKAEGFQARIAEIMKRAPGLPALSAPAPEPDAEPEPVEDKHGTAAADAAAADEDDMGFDGDE